LSSRIQCDLNNFFGDRKNSFTDAKPVFARPFSAMKHWFSAAVPLRPVAAESIPYFLTRYKEQLWQRK
jgi:hypothetical protein